MSASAKATSDAGMPRGRLVFYLTILVFAVILIYLFGYRDMRFFLVPSGSMEPSLLPGDRLVTLNKPAYRRGDIVVLREPADETSYLVKRIVAVEGDTVSIRGGALFLNGYYASESYTNEPMKYSLDPPITVGAGEVFILGDNRNHSEDSSLWRRAYPADRIVGGVVYIYFPFSRAGQVNRFPLTNSQGG
jgi:signal peptidase I